MPSSPSPGARAPWDFKFIVKKCFLPPLDTCHSFQSPFRFCENLIDSFFSGMSICHLQCDKNTVSQPGPFKLHKQMQYIQLEYFQSYY